MAVDFQATQRQFAAYIRNPAENPAPDDVDPKRMAMYRELFFNNIDGFLSGNFPVLRAILSYDQWQTLTEDFFARHQCQTPHFSEIAEEFLAFLQNERDNPDDFPFMLELAHYEWVEMALSIAQAEPQLGGVEFVENLLQQTIALSPLAWPVLYQYPVQAIAPDFLPLTPPEQATCLIVYRDSDDHVHFLKTTALTLAVLQHLQDDGPMSAENCLLTIAAEFPQIDAETSIAHGLPMLRELAEKGIIIPAVAA
jgi:uncharacterized protein